MASNISLLVLGFLGCFVVTAAAAVLGSIASRNARFFYAGLSKPAWFPPGWIFGPVWTVLYILMAIAACLVWWRGGWSGAAVALTLFVVQLVLNALWSWLFFAWHRGSLAFGEILVLFVLICATLVAFARVDVLAAVLLVPYVLWVGFASALTYATWRRNPAQLR